MLSHKVASKEFINRIANHTKAKVVTKVNQTVRVIKAVNQLNYIQIKVRNQYNPKPSLNLSDPAVCKNSRHHKKFLHSKDFDNRKKTA